MTFWTPSSGYNSGDYQAVVDGVTLRYSTCGNYTATYRGRREVRPVPRYDSGETVVFDLTTHGGPRIEILGER